MFNFKNKKGISLIVLIITIIVMAILATVVIANMNGDNSISAANELKIKSQVDNMKEEYNSFVAHMQNEYITKGKSFNVTKLNANNSNGSAKYDGESIDNISSINDIITNIPDDFKGYFKIVNGKLEFDSTASGELTDVEKGYITEVIGEWFN